MTKKKPKPVRLTQIRAIGLVEAAERGLTAWREEIATIVNDPDASLEQMRHAQELDDAGVAAMDGVSVIRERYGWKRDAEAETLF